MSLMLDAEQTAFLAARLRRLFTHFKYELPAMAKDDKVLIRVAAPCIGALLTRVEAEAVGVDLVLDSGDDVDLSTDNLEAVNTLILCVGSKVTLTHRQFAELAGKIRIAPQ